MNTWIEVTCAHCGQANLVDNGDPFDMTVTDIEGFECWKCHGNNAFDDDGEAVATEDEQADDGRIPPSEADRLVDAVRRVRQTCRNAIRPFAKDGAHALSTQAAHDQFMAAWQELQEVFNQIDTAGGKP